MTYEGHTVDLDVPCVEWTRALTQSGYGHYWDPATRSYVDIHRQTWIKAYGPIGPGLVVMHACDNPPCYELRHLELGTQAQNLADMRAKGRGAKGERVGTAKLTEAEVREIRSAL